MNTLRSWHRRLAVLVGAFVLFQGITGAISQQRFALMALSEPEIYSILKVMDDQLSPAEIIDLISAAKPEFRPAHVMLPMENSPQTAAIVMGGRSLTGLDMSQSVTVDQYTGSIIAERPSSSGWVGIFTGLHKWTKYGSGGRLFLIVMGLLTVAFMLTGLALWWKSRKYAHRFMGLRRWHRLAGSVVGFLLICVSVSGIALNLVTWQEKSVGLSVVGGNMRAGMTTEPPGEEAIGLDVAWTVAMTTVNAQRLAAFADIGPHAGQYWFAFTDKQLRRTDVLVDPITAIASVYPSGVYEGGSGVRSWLLPIHTGYVAGVTGGYIMTFVGITLIFWAVSGFILWSRSSNRHLALN